MNILALRRETVWDEDRPWFRTNNVQHSVRVSLLQHRYGICLINSKVSKARVSWASACKMRDHLRSSYTEPNSVHSLKLIQFHSLNLIFWTSYSLNSIVFIVWTSTQWPQSTKTFSLKWTTISQWASRLFTTLKCWLSHSFSSSFPFIFQAARWCSLCRIGWERRTSAIRAWPKVSY